jgi:transposase
MSSRFLAVDLSRQILPGSFEFALSHLIDHLSLTAFESRFRNDAVGAPAYSPAVLLKIVLLGYSKGIVHSRDIEAACRDNVVFMAISGDSHPHFTTIAHFVASLSEPIADVFAQVLAVCDQEGLIGRQMFAIDGVKLPSNASKAKSGTRSDFMRQAAKMRTQVSKMIERHRSRDQSGSADEALKQCEARHIERLTREAQQIERWLEHNAQDRHGPRNKVRQSNRTDNQSAKMATDKGVIQGYTAVAAVDDKHQIIVQAQAHGVGNEQELLIPVIEALQPLLSADTVVTADAGYYSKANLQALDERDIQACIADPNYRSRDPRYAGQQQHKAKPDALWDKRPKHSKQQLFRPQEFQVAADLTHCICPAGKRLYRNGRHRNLNGFEAVKFTGTKRDCEKCPLRAQCLRHPQRTQVRQVAIFLRKVIIERQLEQLVERMKELIDSERGHALITQRFATVEPVFGNVRFNKALNRFTLRGQAKVDGQWKLYGLVHNIEKLANNGYAG